MKRLLLIIVLTLSFQTLSKADDISDFQIEGISIGDSALDYFSKQEIISNMRALKIGKKKYSKEFSEYIYDDKSKLENYDYIAVIFKIDDSKFIIQSISARINFSHKNINKCYELQKSVIKVFGNLLSFPFPLSIFFAEGNCFSISFTIFFNCGLH